VIKKYIDWINEEIETDYKVKSPVDIEIITGNVRTNLDPQAEDWRSQSTHLDDYKSLQKDVRKAISEDDASKIEKLIGKAKETPLFLKEPETIWKRKQIENMEPMRSDADFNRWVARYIVNKLGVFISWCENTKE
jgi:hypothetical protein